MNDRLRECKQKWKEWEKEERHSVAPEVQCSFLHGVHLEQKWVKQGEIFGVEGLISRLSCM